MKQSSLNKLKSRRGIAEWSISEIENVKHYMIWSTYKVMENRKRRRKDKEDWVRTPDLHLVRDLPRKDRKS